LETAWQALFGDKPLKVPPSGGSLEIGNRPLTGDFVTSTAVVPPSGGSLEIGNPSGFKNLSVITQKFPLRGDP